MSFTAPRAAAAFAVAVLLAALLPSSAAPAAEPEQEQEFVEIGTLPRLADDARRIFGETVVPHRFVQFAEDTPSNGTMLPVHEARQLWQIYKFSDGVSKTAVAVRDMDTLRIIATFVVGGGVERRGGVSFGGGWLHTVDPGGRVFLFVAGEVVSVDFRTFAQRRYVVTTPIGIPIGGASYDPYLDRLLFISGGPGSTTTANTYTQVQAVDLTSGEVSPGRRLRTCNGPQPSVDQNKTYQVDPYITERYVYVPCHRAGNVGTVTRVDRNALFDPLSDEEGVAGPINLETTMVDRKSGRIFMATIRGVVWIFDTATMAYIGVVGGNTNRSGDEDMGYGLDPASGRFYFQSPTFGLGVVEGRHFPVPQAKARLDLAHDGQELLIADDKSRRLFVLGGMGQDKDAHYRVYRTLPAPAPPPPPDPDRNTVDQPEAAGLNESRYNAGASGYGVRVLLINGFSTVPPAPTLGDFAPTTSDLLVHNINSKCGFTDRELVAARVPKTEADTGSAAAEAAAVAIDPRTRLDLDRPSRCEPYAKNGQDYLEAVFATAPEPYDSDGQTSRWNRDPAVCSTSQGDKPQASDGDDHGAPALGSSRVECPTPGDGDLRASAHASLTGPIAVDRAQVETRVTRGAGRIRVTAEAKAENVEIGEGIVINEIRSTAASESTGRPRADAMSTHAVTLRGVSIGGKQVCDVCDLKATLETLNRAVAGRAEFRFGHAAPDSRLLRGSPRGALTAVQKSPERQVSDRALVGDFTSDIPALELVVYNDNSKWGRARQIYQFAGVSTSAMYNIVPVPRFDGLGDDAGENADDDNGTVDAVAIDGASASVDVPLDLQAVSSGSDGGGGVLGAISRALRAVGRGLVLFATDPRHGLAILTGWALLGLPLLLFRRRLSVAAGADIAPRSVS